MPSLRSFRRLVPVLLLLLVAPAASLAPAPGRAQEPERPNFIVVVTDDQRAETLRFMDTTTRLLHETGTNYPNAFATTPLCCPSRSSIFSGRFAHNHGVKTNFNPEPLDHETTVEYYLDKAGYRTAIFGKFLNRWHDDPPFFDEWAIPRGRKYVGNDWMVDGERMFVQKYSTSFIGDQILEFMNESEATDEEPWLMFVAPLASHTPFTPQSRYRYTKFNEWNPGPAINERDVSDKAWFIRRMDPVKLKRAESVRTRQLRTLLSVDDVIESTYQSLEELGELDNTYIIVMSDNGYSWGDHRLLSTGANKNTPYTFSVRVPFGMIHPTAPPEGTDERLVANIDVAPTILELAGVQATGPPMDGRSLVDDRWSRDWMLLEWWNAKVKAGIPPWRSIISTDKQYIEYLRREKVIRREFYNLAEDPSQLRNMMGDGNEDNNPDVARLHKLVERLSTCSGGSCP